jgi:hypothetical protein
MRTMMWQFRAHGARYVRSVRKQWKAEIIRTREHRSHLNKQADGRIR